MDTDTWWHLRAGEWMFQHKAILQQDIFSYTRYGQEWNYPGWLIQIPMYLIYKMFGPGGLNIWTAVNGSSRIQLHMGYIERWIFFESIFIGAGSCSFWSLLVSPTSPGNICVCFRNVVYSRKIKQQF